MVVFFEEKGMRDEFRAFISVFRRAIETIIYRNKRPLRPYKQCEWVFRESYIGPQGFNQPLTLQMKVSIDHRR